MKSGLFLLLAGAMTPILTLSALADAPAPHHASVEYALGSAAQGDVQGYCTGQAAIFPEGAGGFAFSSRGGVLEHYTTEFNLSAVDPHGPNPGWTIINMRQLRDDPIRVSAGDGHLSWNATGAARIFGDGWPFEYGDEGVLPFHASYHVKGVVADPPSELVNAGTFYATYKGRVYKYLNGVPETNSLLQFSDGTVTITENPTLYFHAVQLDAGDVHSAARPYRENISSFETDLVGYYRVHLHHYLLRLNHAHVDLDASQAKLACQGGGGQVEGAWMAYDARGRIQADSQLVEFDRKELTLNGLIRYEERVVPAQNNQPARSTVTGDGQFTAVGIDFAEVTAPSQGKDPWVEVGLWAVIAATLVGALAYAAKALGPFYTRLERPALLDQATRNTLTDALRNQPWMNVSELQRSTGLGRSTVRYQLSVLARHGLVRARPTTWGSRYAVLEGMTPPLPADAAAELIRRELSQGPIRLSTLMRLLQGERGLSRSGAWKSVQKSVKAGVASLERREWEVWVRIG